MISIIVSSLKKERLCTLRCNIADTIGDGVDFELLSRDNTIDPLPLAKVYNLLAAKAKGDCLLFIHEDAGFISSGWGEIIEKKLSDKDCGLIGFAGGKVVADAPGGWNVAPEFCIWHFRECGIDMSLNHNPDADFTPVAAIDGYAFFVRREVWKEIPFDEKALRGFHCYDVDYSLSVGRKYRNYVCENIYTYHDSPGNFGKDWTLATGDIYLEKWQGMLPVLAPGFSISEMEMKWFREKVFFRYIKSLRRFKLPDTEWIKLYKRLPATPLHLRHLIKLPFLK